MAPPTTLSTKRNPSPRASGGYADIRHSELSMASGLLLVLAFGVGLLRDVSRKGDTYVFCVDVYAELAMEALASDGKVSFTCARKQGLVGFVVAVARRARGLLPATGSTRSSACPRHPWTTV